MTDRPESGVPRIIALTSAPLNRLAGALHGLREGKLWRKVIVGLALGVLFGFALGPDVGWVSPSAAIVIVEWVALPGTLFLATIQMIVVPLVFASIIGGLAAHDDTAKLRTLGIRAGIYFASTSAIAIIIGLTVAFLVRPGDLIDRSMLDGVSNHASNPGGPMQMPSLADVPDTLITLLPENPLHALASGQMLQIVLFAFVMGVALVVMPVNKAQPLIDLLESLQGVCMTVVTWAMRIAPVAVFGLSVRLTAKVGVDALVGIAAYVGTVLLGLLLLTAAYAVVVLLLARRSPVSFFRAIRDVQLLGFSTSSSAAVMPLSMKTAEEDLGVGPETARFVIPLGATVNMDGTALYQGVAAAFLIQVYGVEMGFGAMALLVVTVVAASIGAPAAPGVGIVILAGVLDNIGIPSAGIALIVGVDRILDMARTGVNVTGDLTAAVVLERWSTRKRDESQRECGSTT